MDTGAVQESEEFRTQGQFVDRELDVETICKNFSGYDNKQGAVLLDRIFDSEKKNTGSKKDNNIK